MKKLFVATNNASKLKELSAHLSSYLLVTPKDFDSFEPKEDGLTFKENALFKARFWHKITGLPTLADDSGLNIQALNNWPGVQTSEVVKEFGTYEAAKHHIFNKLSNYSDHSAFFICVLAYIDKNGHEHLFEGRLNGKFVWPPKGAGGFAYDDVFQPDGYNQTVAELGHAWKKENSHRARSVKYFMEMMDV